MKGWPYDTIGIPGRDLFVRVPHELVNDHDPDVSFAYCFCGSMGSAEESAAAVARGIENATFVPASFDPATWVQRYDAMATWLGLPSSGTVDLFPRTWVTEQTSWGQVMVEVYGDSVAVRTGLSVPAASVRIWVTRTYPVEPPVPWRMRSRDDAVAVLEAPVAQLHAVCDALGVDLGVEDDE